MAKVSAYFSNVFGRSPFGDLQQHVARCVMAAKELQVLFPASNEGDWDAVEQAYDRLTEIENEADLQKRAIRSNLPQGFFLPVARADVLDLLGRQDEIANTARDVAGLVLGRQLQFPPELQAMVLALVDGSIETCIRANGVVDMLDELIESGFKGRGALTVVEMIEKVEEAEHATDGLVVEIRTGLFRMEDELAPVHVIFLYRVLDLVSELADVAERVAHRVQMMLAK